jgi:LysM repeat protein
MSSDGGHFRAMRSTIQVLLTFTVLLAAPATASAAFPHVVAPGESLSSVAAADGLSVDQLAAANGVSSSAGLVAGSTLMIPPQTSAGTTGVAASAQAAAPATTATSEEAGEVTPDGDEGTAEAAPASPGGGGYLVQPGDTLSAIAAANGITVGQLAAANGLDPNGLLLAGSTLSFGGSSSGAAAPGGAQPTAQMVSPSDVGQVAAANGVSPSLAQAIGDQESGFNNGLVSSTGATGVMQIEPGTWNYIQGNLAGSSLSPTSAQDNVRGGVLLLRSLLDQTGGDPSLAAAGYYQGLRSVQQHGMYLDTQRYVANVMALQRQFGGP